MLCAHNKKVNWHTVFFAIVFFVAVSCGQAQRAWPSVEGAIKGEVKLSAQSPVLALPWTLSFKTEPGSGQTFAFVIEGAGTRVRATGQMNLVTGDGLWRIDDAQLDPAGWFAAVAPVLAPALAGTVAQGQVVVSGGGTISQGQPIGLIEIEWREGALIHPVQGWKLEGIAFHGMFAVDGAGLSLVSTDPFALRVRTITTARFGARNLGVSARLNAQHALSVLYAQLEIAGGDALVEPCEIPLSPLVFDANVRITRVGLQDIVVLVPTAGVAYARGRIDGLVRAKWSAVTGFQLGIGQLLLRDDEPAIMKLTPFPGLITAQLSAGNPAFAALRRIELGKTPIKLQLLSVEITPEGDAKGRTAKVHIRGAPEDAQLRAPLDVQLNVVGPLNYLLKLGLDDRMHVGGVR